MLVFHPHGVINLGFTLNSINFPTVNLAGSRVILSVPVTGMICKLLGGVTVK